MRITHLGILNLEKLIQTSIGEIHLWKVENYSTRIAAGEKKRSIERAEVRLKLNALGYINELLYKETGQPYLKDLKNSFLSISHSNGVIAIYIASETVGIDVEHERKSMFEGRNYFVNQEEEQMELTSESLQLIWGAKEAFYKKLEGQIADLKNDVTLVSYDLSTKRVELRYQSELLQLNFLIIDEIYLIFS